MVGDIVHVTDLYTTFARLAGAEEQLQTDRIVDGGDQTSLLLNGDDHSRRDYVFVYTGNVLGATVKKQYEQHWVSSDATASSDIAAYFDLHNDSREAAPLLVNMMHFKEPFHRMRARHELWKEKYPDRPAAREPAYTWISNARPATLALSKPPVDLDSLPFDPLAFIKGLHELPFDPGAEPDLGR